MAWPHVNFTAFCFGLVSWWVEGGGSAGSGGSRLEGAVLASTGNDASRSNMHAQNVS